jgi:hypothetical protein
MIQKITASALLYLADSATPSPGGGGAPSSRDPLSPVNPNDNLLPKAGNALSQILAWAMYGAVTACGLAAIISAGFAGWAKMTARPQHFERGINAFMWAVGSGFLVGIAIPLVNTFYNLSLG